mmetsp:Transcript_37237/g.89954  ORF Transcript_37237/g.89954 Transcript_37237/m.89954 type:complete len:241 (-) Transcript_37237:135-857(-)
MCVCVHLREGERERDGVRAAFPYAQRRKRETIDHTGHMRPPRRLCARLSACSLLPQSLPQKSKFLPCWRSPAHRPSPAFPPALLFVGANHLLVELPRLLLVFAPIHRFLFLGVHHLCLLPQILKPVLGPAPRPLERVALPAVRVPQHVDLEQRAVVRHHYLSPDPDDEGERVAPLVVNPRSDAALNEKLLQPLPHLLLVVLRYRDLPRLYFLTHFGTGLYPHTAVIEAREHLAADDELDD